MLLPSTQAGRGRPVVLLHARPTDRTMWNAHLPLLAEAGVRAIALDLPGHGDATVPDRRVVAPWSDVLDTLDHLGADRFVLAGNSLGALVALQVAVTAPERVDGLALVGYRPHDQPASPRLDAAWEAERTALAAGDLEAAVKAGVEAWTSTGATEEVRTHAARMLHRQLTEQLTHGEPPQATDPLGTGPAPLRALRGVAALVGVGEHDMPDFHEGGESLARDLGAGRITVIPDAGHLAPLEQPAVFCTLLLDFVRRLPQQSSPAHR
ncbi:alpha/beta fold hydrolase [Kitasatospora aureofaciens]|uniref:3-oxoadipate enol-lactonase n=1 Tax=Kitasatospora aureofaciens TaxID=1894 RepID=A0A1E7N8R1_KITAU|nr:alpha/beta hydrolase [Kitasatospora aureofaciens]ARF81657.1 3-oxoadipate enol-lactonase [Kitasatospora aureofaciens]OEV37072.1 3-oxoadipate enol-lactonase [Kitasatospora aureofaciens]GGV01333.1 alpha/beta hydrolase [Kitasatospora aureofaciens]